MAEIMISICIPTHDMENKDFFLGRCLDSIESQTYRNFEIVITNEGKMAENTNAAIKKAKGDIIKILFMDDYLAHPGALKQIADNFTGGWLVSCCLHSRGEDLIAPHSPTLDTEKIRMGLNTIGSPSILAFENKEPLLFDEKLSWVLDCDLYLRLFERYGPPTFISDYGVVMGIGPHQTTHILSDEEKMAEHNYLINKYQ